MMQRVAASAPGKLVLTGEYAVLDGAPAVSAAVDVRALVEIQSTSERCHQLIVLNTGEKLVFDLSSSGEVCWRDEPGEYGALIESVLGVLQEHGWPGDDPDNNPLHNGDDDDDDDDDGDRAGLSISIDTRSFYERTSAGAPKKKGVGSSAAVAVALTGALNALAGQQPDLSCAKEAHGRFQGNRGSGIDVVTSWQGGLVLMLADSSIDLEWPEDFYVLPVLIGEPASTTAKLRQLEHARASWPERYKKLSDDLNVAASHAAQCWQSGESEALLAAIRQFASSLQRMDEELELGIWSDAHLELKAAAAECRVVYKPSGAGGGDCGVAFSTEPDAMQKFADKACQLGYLAGSLEWSNEGLSIVHN